MSVRVVEIDPAAAIAMVDLAGAVAAGCGVVLDPRGAGAGERRIEFRLADQEGVVLGSELLAIGKIEGDAIGGADRHEVAPFRSRFEVQDVGEKLGGLPPVPCRDDRVIEFHAHLCSSLNLPKPYGG